MIARRVAWLGLALLAATGCGTTVERGYYAPLGVGVSSSIAVLQDKRPDLIIDVKCQGVYMNTVDGEDTRTAHLQLDITRTSASQLLFSVDGFRLDCISEVSEAGPDEDVEVLEDATLTPHEVWSRRTRLHQTVLVNPWSNRSLDLFFDFADEDQPIPAILRFRWRAESGTGWSYGDYQFLRIPVDDPDIPAKLADTDKQFGVRNGYYFPGYGVLGSRHLRDSVEARPHYLFHAP
jgi:hypothetical protein